MLKVGDVIIYGFYSNIKIIGEDEFHFILEDKKGNIKKVYKHLVNKHGRLLEG